MAAEEVMSYTSLALKVMHENLSKENKRLSVDSPGDSDLGFEDVHDRTS